MNSARTDDNFKMPLLSSSSMMIRFVRYSLNLSISEKISPPKPVLEYRRSNIQQDLRDITKLKFQAILRALKSFSTCLGFSENRMTF